MKSRYHEDELVDYVSQGLREEPKETFKFLNKLIAENHQESKMLSLVDVGCACGDFLQLIAREHPTFSLVGMDYQEEYVYETSKRLPRVEAVRFDITEPLAEEFQNRFDIVTMIGFHAKFDEPKDWLANGLQMLTSGGVLYALGPFNVYPFDVFVKYKHSEDPPDMRHPGFNLLSMESVEHYLATQGGTCEWLKFELPIDLPIQEDNPVRTWTFKDENGRRLVVNGLGVIQSQYVVVIRKNG